MTGEFILCELGRGYLTYDDEKHSIAYTDNPVDAAIFDRVGVNMLLQSQKYFILTADNHKLLTLAEFKEMA